MTKQKDFNVAGQCPLAPTLVSVEHPSWVYPKNTTTKLQAMDQGVITNLKTKYAKHMFNVARAQVKNPTVQRVTKIVKDISIFDGIIHAKCAWDAVDPETIVKCFAKSRIKNFNTPATESFDNTTIDGDKEFDNYFQELLDMPLDQYLAMDEELKMEFPCRAPDTQAYPIEEDGNNMEPETTPSPPISFQDAIEQLKQIQKLVLCNKQLFDLANQLSLGVQTMRVQCKLTRKCKQTLAPSL